MSDSFLCSPPFSRRLLYYTTSAFLCQEVFPKFFELFSTASLRSASVSQSLLSATFILYHIRFALSSGFSNFFSSFFQTLVRFPYALPSPRQPRYYIISSPTLSIPFSPCCVTSAFATKKRCKTSVFLHRFAWQYIQAAQWQSAFFTLLHFLISSAR